MELGGAERSLLGLLETFDYSRYEVDLFLIHHEGELLSYIPNEVNLLPEISAYTVLARPMKQVVREGHFLLTLSRLYAKIKARKFEKLNNSEDKDSAVEIEYSHKYTNWLMPRINPDVTYDIAISFLTPHYFVRDKINAYKKIAWIHTDYSAVFIDQKSEELMWKSFDSVISISDNVTEQFLKVFPFLVDKIVLIENILPQEFVRKQSMAFNPDNEMRGSDLKILSIGRFSYQKNFEAIPKITKEILKKGVSINWYLIGFGAHEQMIVESINENGMQDHVFILGKKENPYPYIMACDVYIQPSRYEGKSVTVREAQMLGKPVIITDFPTSGSQLEDKVDGIIVPMEIEECAKEIASVLMNLNLLDTLKYNCLARDYSNSREIRKLYDLI